MPLLPITPPPGIKTNGSEYSNKNSWVEADLCRFENGFLTNIGGWQKAKTNKCYLIVDVCSLHMSDCLLSFSRI